MNTLETMQRFYDAEFGEPSFGSGFADALAVRSAVKTSLKDMGAADAFEAVVAQAPDVETRLRFAALIADMANPFSLENNGDSQPYRLGVYAVATTAFAKTLQTDPAATLKVLTEYPDSFAASPHIAGMSMLFMSHQAASMADGPERHSTVKATRYIANVHS